MTVDQIPLHIEMTAAAIVDVVRAGARGGNKKAASSIFDAFERRITDDDALWVDSASATPAMPQDTVCFELPLHIEIAAAVRLDAVRAEARGGDDKPQTLRAALAIAACVAGIEPGIFLLSNQRQGGATCPFEAFERRIQ